MLRACAWCGILMGVTPPVETDGTTHGMCRRCAERLRRQELGPCPRVLIVVRAVGLAEEVAAAFGALRGIAVVPDRREGQRRRERSPAPTERRQLDRRRAWLSQRDPWFALGVQVVPVGDADSRSAG